MRNIKKTKDKYLFLGNVIRDGQKFVVQEEEPNTNPHNPSGLGTYVFNHLNYTGWKKL